MKRISDEMFLNTKPNPDKVFGIRVKDGEFYFLAMMEDAEHYKIKKAMISDGYMLDRGSLIFDGNIMGNIENTSQYNKMQLLYETDDNGGLVRDDEKMYQDEYEMFLSLVNCYERNGVSDDEDHDILVLTKDELSSFCDLLRDGDYVLVVDDAVNE